MLHIKSAAYTLLDGVPALRLDINGQEAFVCDVNLDLLKAGYVYLISLTPGFQWEDALPELMLPAIPGVSVAPRSCSGITDDPGVLRLTRAFTDTLQGKNGQRFTQRQVPL
jgi:hypothetical protein